MVSEISPDIVFETTDYSNRPVTLSRSTWRKKAGNGEPGSHPEIKDYLDDIQSTVENPDYVFQSTRDPRASQFYKLSIGRERFIGKHLVVIVKYVDETSGIRGYVSTIYLSRSAYAQGNQLWPQTDT